MVVGFVTGPVLVGTGDRARLIGGHERRLGTEAVRKQQRCHTVTWCCEKHTNRVAGVSTKCSDDSETQTPRSLSGRSWRNLSIQRWALLARLHVIRSVNRFNAQHRAWVLSLVSESTALGALLLALRLLIGDVPSVAEERVSLCDGKVSCIVFRPPNSREARKPRPRKSTIVVAHGLNPYGINDTRVQKIARGLASLGFTAVMPEIQPFKECRIGNDAVSVLVSVLDSIASNPTLSPCGQISLFGASMSGSCGIIAACDSRVSKKVGAILCVGSFNSVRTASMRAMRSRPQEDSTARNLLLYNFLKESYESPGACDIIGSSFNQETREEIYTAAKLSVLDNTSCEPSNLLGAFLQSRPAVASEFKRLQEDVSYRISHAERIIPRVEGLMESLSPQNYVGQVECRQLVIVHGLRDEVNHHREAQNLHERFSRRQQQHSNGHLAPRSHLCITPLITHGERAPFKLHYIPSVLQVIFAVYVFLAAANTAPGHQLGGNAHRTTRAILQPARNAKVARR